MRRFKIKPFESPYYPAGSPYFFWAYVFDTEKEMYDWYFEYVKKRECDPNKDWDTFKFGGFRKDCDFAAMCIPFEVIKIDRERNEERGANIGNIIFYRGAIGAGIVSHEMGHCAMWYERLINGNKQARFGTDVGDREERLLYLLHDFVKGFYQKAYKLKLI